jgi:hypothetical protein
MTAQYVATVNGAVCCPWYRLYLNPASFGIPFQKRPDTEIFPLSRHAHQYIQNMYRPGHPSVVPVFAAENGCAAAIGKPEKRITGPGTGGF